MTFLSFVKSHKKLLIITLIATVAVVLILAAILIYFVSVEEINKAAVVTNGHGCSQIGINILEKGGNAVDAAIAALFCEGVAMPQSMGLGGGFLMTIYNRTTGEAWSLNSRERAPAAAHQDMFHGNADLSLNGGLSVAVPAELRGYWMAYKKFGGDVPWRDLVQPTIDMCKNGILVTPYVGNVLRNYKESLYADKVLREIFIKPETNDTYSEGEYYTRPRLARTLEIIAEEGGNALHNGSLTEAFVQDIRDHDGIITVDDLKKYTPEWSKPVTSTINGNHNLYSSPVPGSGAILAFIMNILDGFLNESNPFSIVNYQRIVESFKFAYAKRTELGDEKFVPNVKELVRNLTRKDFAESIRWLIHDNSTSQNGSYYGATSSLVEDHGTAHISVLSSTGDAVAVTSTINYVFGAEFASNSTGIILNDQMDDFSSPNITNVYGVPPSPSNYIVGGKTPISSMSPTIIVDGNGDVQMVVGAAGGSKITTSVAQVIINHLWYGFNMKMASDQQRFHHQLYPMQVDFENSFKIENANIPVALKDIGHHISFSEGDGFAAVTAISALDKNTITAVSDKRRQGSVSYLT
ncbi:glutathione hydrolase 1 proenzyme isoform X2 [Leptinotarsa decemlineata]|uniref:glutathione hydrolase 1 proenzyme isoform X2 n=1 Tax=Leptinotarsa decemlineata TaxID=7539 RepID=UPI003D305BCF